MKQLNRYLVLLFATALLTASFSAEAKSRVQRIYAFGFAASFNDSTVYFTDIQPIDSAWLAEKSDFLVSRQNYSYQLRDYLAEKGENHRTCIIVYSPKREKAEKKYIKMRKKYTAKGDFSVKYIASSEFRFSPIEPDLNAEQEAVPAKKDKKKKKAERRIRPDGNRPPHDAQGAPGEGFGM